MIWKYVLLGVAAYILGVALFITGSLFGAELLEARGNVYAHGNLTGYGYIIVGSFGLIPGVITTPMFFTVFWLFRRRLPMAELLAMLVFLALSYLLGIGSFIGYVLF